MSASIFSRPTRLALALNDRQSRRLQVRDLAAGVYAFPGAVNADGSVNVYHVGGCGYGGNGTCHGGTAAELVADGITIEPICLNCLAKYDETGRRKP